MTASLLLRAQLTESAPSEVRFPSVERWIFYVYYQRDIVFFIYAIHYLQSSVSLQVGKIFDN
jgi:hypothetical protein